MGAVKPIKISNKSQKPIKLNNEIKKKRKFKIDIKDIILIALFIFIIVLIVNTYLLNNKISNLKEKNSENKMEIRSLKRENSSLNSENISLSNFKTNNEYKLKFFNERVVFVIDGFGNYYYTYDCMMKKVGNNKFIFWAYNTEQARDRGYRQGSC